MTFLLQNWKLIGLGLALAFAAFMWSRADHWKAQAEKMEARANTEAVNHQATKDAYRTAQEQAQQAETARLARVRAEQERITDDIAKDYAARLADARARADRLRSQIGKAAVGAPNDKRVPCLPVSSGGVDGATCDQGLSIHERLVATEQAIQLEALQTWVKQQTAIDPN